MSRGFKMAMGVSLALALVLVLVAWRAGAFDSANDYRRPAGRVEPKVVVAQAVVVDAAEAPALMDAEDPPMNIPVVDVTLAKLAADYAENEVAADDKYKDQVLNLHAAVHRILKEQGKAVLELQIGESHNFVRALFESEKGLAALKPGQQLTAHCFCQGYVASERYRMQILALNSCELQ